MLPSEVFVAILAIAFSLFALASAGKFAYWLWFLV